MLAILVQLIQLHRHFTRHGRVFTEQAFNAQTHVVQPSGGVQARPEDEAQIGGVDTRRIAPRHFQHSTQPGARTAGTNTRQPLMHQNAVIGIQRDHVGDAAQRHQIKQFPQIRFTARRVNQPSSRSLARSASKT